MALNYNFGGRTAVVAGGSGGIGRCIVARLVASGASVWTWDVACPPGDGSGKYFEVDVTKPEQVSSAVSRVIAEAGAIDILVNSAGLLGPYKAFDHLTRAEWDRIIEVNLVGAMDVCNQVVPHMLAAGHGLIVNMGSLAAKQGLANLVAYSAASGGVVAFSKALAQELVQSGIRVNCVAPGPIDTTLITDLGPDIVRSMVAASPMKRLGMPAEVAELVVWLCSDSCTFATGAVYDVSGGRASY